MAKFADLVKGFRSNVRNGIPSTLHFTGERVHLTAERKDGMVGLCDRPSPKPRSASDGLTIEHKERIAKDRTNDMTQDQFKAAMDAFMLEPDNNLFAVTNAITRAAQGFEGEAKYDMERLGAKVLGEGLRSRN